MVYNMRFSQALDALLDGKVKEITREGWSDVSVALQRPDENSFMTEPYLYMIKKGKRFPISLSCESVLAEDWALIVRD